MFFISKFSLCAMFSLPILSASLANFFLFPDHSNVSTIVGSEKALEKNTSTLWGYKLKVWLDYFLSKIRAGFQMQTMRRCHSEDGPICLCPLKFTVLFVLILLPKSWHLLMASGIRKGEERVELAGKKGGWGWIKVCLLHHLCPFHGQSNKCD